MLFLFNRKQTSSAPPPPRAGRNERAVELPREVCVAPPAAAVARQRHATASAPHAMATLAVRARLNGQVRWIPLQVSDGSQASVLDEAAAMIADAGGIEAGLMRVPMAVARIWLPRPQDADSVRRRLRPAAKQLLQLGADALVLAEQTVPGGHVPALSIRRYAGGRVGVLLSVASVDDSARRALETAARAVAPQLAGLLRCGTKLDIQLGTTSSARVRARCRVPLLPFASARERSADRLLRSFFVDEHQPAFALFHNARIIAAMSAAARALKLGPASWEDDARQHAARWGSCEPLARWGMLRHMLIGELQLPLSIDALYAPRSAGTRAGDLLHTRQAVREKVIQIAAVGLTASFAQLRATLRTRLSASDYRSPPPLPSRASVGARPTPPTLPAPLSLAGDRALRAPQHS